MIAEQLHAGEDYYYYHLLEYNSRRKAEEYLARYDSPDLDRFIAEQIPALERLQHAGENEYDYSTHAIITPIRKHGLWFVRKIYGIRKKYSLEEISELYADYQTYLADLAKAGITHVSESYERRLNERDNTFQVEQVFWPYTALDAVRAENGKNMRQIVGSVCDDIVIPALEYRDPQKKYTPMTSGVRVDVKLQNVGMDPITGQAWYIDEFPARILDAKGHPKMAYAKTKENKDGKSIDTISRREGRYRYYTYPGMIHAFYRANAIFNLGNTPDLQEAFLAAADEKLGKYREAWFPGLNARELAETEFKKGENMVRKRLLSQGHSTKIRVYATKK